MKQKTNKILAGVVFILILCTVPAASFAWWSNTWSADGKYLKLNFNYNKDAGPVSSVTDITYKRDDHGNLLGRIYTYVLNIDDEMGRTVNTTNQINYGIQSKILSTSFTGNYKHTNRYLYQEILKKTYYYDTNGIWEGFSAFNNIYGRLPGGISFKGSASYSTSIRNGVASMPMKKETLKFYKYGSLNAISKFTVSRLYNSNNYLTRSSLNTMTYFANGAYRNSIIKTIYNRDSSGNCLKTTITGIATGYDVVNHKKVSYKSIMFMPTHSKTDCMYYYKEVRSSSSKTLNKNIPYEAVMYKDLSTN